MPDLPPGTCAAIGFAYADGHGVWLTVFTDQQQPNTPTAGENRASEAVTQLSTREKESK